MNSPLIGLRISLSYGIQYQLKLPIDEVERVMKAWRNKTADFIGGIEPGPGGITWWTRADQIIGMHTYDIALLMQQAQAAQMQIPNTNLPYSGLGAR